MAEKQFLMLKNRVAFLLILVLVFSLGCSSSSVDTVESTGSESESIDSVVLNEHKSESNNANTLMQDLVDSSVVSMSSEVTTSSSISFQPDTSINELLFLRNAESVKSIFPSEQIPLMIKGYEFPIGYAINQESNQYLGLIQYHGDVSNQFSVFEIGYLNDIDEPERAINTTIEFQTESGLQLGMSKESLLKIKGAGFTVQASSSDETVLRYEIIDYINSDFLQRYRLPIYYFDVYLTNDLIKKIQFGFEYP